MIWVYFMRERSEVFTIFKRFKSMVEKQSGHHIKSLRNDNGKEYSSKEFDNFCEEEGVERQLTVGYTSQQNGVSERKNQTVMEMAKSMMHEKGLSKNFSAEAVYIAVNYEIMIEEFRNDMMERYEMSDMGLLNHFLGIEFYQVEDGVFISQKKYTENILMKFGMSGCKPMATPLVVNENLQRKMERKEVDGSLYRSLVGNLLYLIATRLNIMYAASLLSSFMNNPSQNHLGAAKRVLRYIQGITSYGIKYCKYSTVKLFGFCDSDWGGYTDDMKSTSGYALSLGFGVFSWSSKK
ncbi:uncharacterized protein LOC114282959 [Camellia sinensis]|uniref:uncharacterized protein LOC114282959 n=1 Tax=Camellia sinensis TaxID=4442 RepID=UPI001036145B|nr:uncharacterized protein LOC114282959 [Camellia sinensis]